MVDSNCIKTEVDNIIGPKNNYKSYEQLFIKKKENLRLKMNNYIYF